ncbi:MAG: SpoIID/LytB domain-containing protein [Oscillospiraceae bacterium]|nr:SpoIID/LytB domain-containing protein [Oscillospiraceae bacterium]
MTNSSLLRCAAAFLVLSVYIWLFGISGVIEDSAEEKFADESLEFIPPAKEVLENGINEGLSAANIAVNPINDPKPGAADFPASEVLSYESIHSANSANNANNHSASSDELNDEDDETPEEIAPPTTPVPTAPAATTTTTPAPTTTTTTTTTITAPTTTTPAPQTTTTTPANGSETAINPALSQRLTVITSNGSVTDTALNIVSRIVQHEIGSSFHTEAIKAQAIAAYTYVMLPLSQDGTARVELAHTASDHVKDCVREVLGLALYYNNEYIQAVYHASSAGYTASSKNVWGTDFPYLRSVKCDFDKEHDSNFGVINTISSTDIKVAVLEKTGIQLSGNPDNWLKIINNDYVDEVYVGAMTVGGHSSYTANGSQVKFTGKILRDILGTRTLRSAAFDFTYNAATDRFTFVTYGYGHGVGMSQNGANILARHYGYDYKQILAHYYPGTTLK